MSLVHRWLPGALVVRDLGWGLVETTVLQVDAAGVRYIVKAGGEGTVTSRGRSTPIGTGWTRGPARASAPVLVHADVDAKVLVTRYLAGELVENSASAASPDDLSSGGRAAARFHGQLAVEERDYEERENQKLLGRLAGPHRIAAQTVDRLRAEILAWPNRPRRWSRRMGTGSRGTGWSRPARCGSSTSAGRRCGPPSPTSPASAAQDFLRDPQLEVAFVRGYGHDPREPGAWQRTQIREAIATAVWAYQVRDRPSRTRATG